MIASLCGRTDQINGNIYFPACSRFHVAVTPFFWSSGVRETLPDSSTGHPGGAIKTGVFDQH